MGVFDAVLRLRKSRDSSGHEHAADGKFGSGGVSTPKPGAKISKPFSVSHREVTNEDGSRATHVYTKSGDAETHVASIHSPKDLEGGGFTHELTLFNADSEGVHAKSLHDKRDHALLLARHHAIALRAQAEAEPAADDKPAAAEPAHEPAAIAA